MTATTDQLRAEPVLPYRAASACLIGAAGPGLRHAGDLVALMDAGQRRWTDALLSETWSHLAGCLNAIELALSLQMAGNWLAGPVEALGPNFCRTAVEQSPAIISPLLLGHLRHRASAALMRRAALRTPPLVIQTSPDADLAPDPLVGDALAALRLSLDPWHDPHPVDRPMRADLAAEPLCDLVWTAAALLVDGLASRMGVDCAAAIPVVARAAQAVIARHDEQTGPFARAAYVATLLDEADTDRQASQAAFGHDLLLLAAIGARRSGIGLDLALVLLIDGGEEERAALVRLLDLSADAYVALLTGLGPVRGEVPDFVLPELVRDYRQITAEAAALKLARWCGPEPLVDRLARIDRSRT
jgi:hypothetical protein